MAGADRMAVEDVVRKVLVDEHADVLREPLRWSVARLMEVEVCEVIGTRARPAPAGSRGASQRLSGARVADARRDGRADESEHF
jgi:hypothetical protein